MSDPLTVPVGPLVRLAVAQEEARHRDALAAIVHAATAELHLPAGAELHLPDLQWKIPEPA